MNKFLMAAVAASFAVAANAAAPAQDKKPADATATQEINAGERDAVDTKKQPGAKAEGQDQSSEASKKTTGNN